MPARAVAGALVRVDDGRSVAGGEAEDDPRDALSRAPLEAAAHAVVDQAEPPVGEEEDVARVRVRVVHAVEQHRDPVHSHERPQSAAKVVPPLGRVSEGRREPSQTDGLHATRERVGGRRGGGAREPQRRRDEADEGRRRLGEGEEAGGAAPSLEVLAHPPHQLLAHRVGGLEAEGGGDVGRLEVDGGRQAGAVEELHREDVARAEALVGQRGEADERGLEAARRQVGPHLGQVARLLPEVELRLVPLAQPLDEGQVLGEQETRHDLEVVEVGLVQRGHLWVLHLDDHLAPVEQRRAVRLGRIWSKNASWKELVSRSHASAPGRSRRRRRAPGRRRRRALPSAHRCRLR
mmetsp:Transcript_44318/g.142729  ORF Transcript_44318/g.142729 Transcript_44318/m.142729 type:complete len:349 (+) Transcript_44318:454-1500(+)